MASRMQIDSSYRMELETSRWKYPELIVLLGLYSAVIWFFVECISSFFPFDVPDLNYDFFHVFHYGVYVVIIPKLCQSQRKKFFVKIVKNCLFVGVKGLLVVGFFTASNTLALLASEPAMNYIQWIFLFLGEFSNILIMYVSLFQLDLFYSVAFSGYAAANAMFFATTQIQYHAWGRAIFYSDGSVVRILLSCWAFSLLCTELLTNMNLFTRSKFWQTGAKRGPMAVRDQIQAPEVYMSLGSSQDERDI